jgi:outer membrane protein OmpA-like peptidoglycan-associated protein
LLARLLRFFVAVEPNINKEQKMNSRNFKVVLLACAITLAFSNVGLGQDSIALSVAPSALRALEIGGVTEGQKLKVEGIVINRNDESFTVRDAQGTELVVVMTAKTKITKERKGWFNLDRSSNESEIRRGLRLRVEGQGNSEGQLVARKIAFDEQDLKTAEALESRVDPVEKQANSTQALAVNNQMRIDGAERRLDQAETNAQRLSGQVDELSTVANTALSSAKDAQSTADQAASDASTANDRINALDDYEVFSKMTVHFKPGSARLSASAKDEIDEMANNIRANLKGWIVAVEGFADSKGRTAKNRSLSERRADAVINYLVTKHGFPPRRVVQPFGYGSLNAVATNETREGRSLNRRAEITILINKGISHAQQTASKEQ